MTKSLIFLTRIRREGQQWMLLENLGIDKTVRFGNLKDWKAAVASSE